MSADSLAQDITRTHEVAAALREFAAEAAARRSEMAALAGECHAAGERMDGLLATLDEAFAGVRAELAETLDALLERLEKLRTDAVAENAKFAAARDAARDAWEDAKAAVGECAGACAAEEQQTHAALSGCTQQLTGYAGMLAGEIKLKPPQWTQAIAGYAHESGERAASVCHAVSDELRQDLDQHVIAPCEQSVLTLQQTFSAFERAAQQDIDHAVGGIDGHLEAFASGEIARAAAIMEQWSATRASMEAIADSIVTLGHGMLETVETVSSGIRTMNVGLEITVGTFNNVRDVFEDIRRT